MPDHPDPTSPTPLTAPDADALVAAVRSAIDTRVPLVNYGRAHTGLGHPPPNPHTPYTFTANTIDHEVRDLVVRADVGCTLAELQTTLARENQFLPIDGDDKLTLAELVDHDILGPLRTGYGGLRDRLLGLTFVDGEARIVKVGGRTVKNVAGYDVTKLLVGAMGELGIITEVNLRTATIPPATLIVDLNVKEPQQLDDFQTTWLTAEAAPTWAVLVYDHQACTLRVGYHGTSRACHVQLRSLETLCDQMTDVRLAASEEYGYDEDQRERAAASDWRNDVPALVKIIVPPATSGFVCQSLMLHPPNDPPRQIEAYPFQGSVFVGGEFNADQARRLDAQIAHVIAPAGGVRVWHRRPPNADDIDPFPPHNTDWPVLQRIKQTLDPHNILNPGRYLTTTP
ncbi:FAD-binding oxidoreductase [Phycisphaerales bacterium AB-hyl4]|uniref:FAD-binding oxidoreductase n=1 Tax=Natronomicrosphaera hydrolytica TaxID=3242702 RepID=A0ABV4U309_9BACT